MTTILCFAASLRTDSINKKLAHSCTLSVQRNQATARFIDLRDFPMPLYDGDLEQSDGVPTQAAALAREIMAADGLVIATPEYNGAPPALLKNSLDWITRLGRADGEPSGKTVMQMKPTLLVSAAPGPMAGMRALVLGRALLSHLGLWVLPQTIGVGNAMQAFDDNNELTDESRREQLDQATATLIRVCQD